MDPTIFDTAYPTLCLLLEKTNFDLDKKRAAAMQPDEFKEAYNHSRFDLNDLMGLLCRVAVPSWGEMAGDELEANLKSIADAIGFDQVRRAYRNKLLVPKAAELEDTRYEIAVTAMACAVLDSGTVQLEKPIPSTAKATGRPKNSDVYGLFHGQAVRIEVTVLHEPPPESVDLDLVQIIEGAPTARKFSATMRFAVKDAGSAEHVRAVIEQLCEHHLSSRGANAEIDGWNFTWKAGSYVCAENTSPIERIRFFDEEDPRTYRVTNEVRHPATWQNLTPQYLLDDAPRYKGVVSWSDLPGAPTNHPVSTKIFGMLSDKLAQCEENTINIVAFGNPFAPNEGDVKAALFGVMSIQVPALVLPPDKPKEDSRAILFMDQAHPERAPKAPFNPTSRLESEEDREQFMGTFRRLSAVWHLRLGSGGLSRMHLNVNASVPVPPELERQLCSADLFATFQPAPKAHDVPPPL